MLYNGVELPNIESVWTDKETYPYAAIVLNTDGVYRLYLSSTVPQKNDAISGLNLIYFNSGKHLRYNYDEDISSWFFFKEDTSGSLSEYYDANYTPWANCDICGTKNGSLYYPATDPVDPNAPTTPTGTIELQSFQVLDDSASFVLSIIDLTDESSVYTVKTSRFIVDELENETVSEPFAGPSMSLHLTSANLTPETEYEFVFTLQYNGEDTDIQTSTTVTTLAGEGEVLPDYSGQLGGIQDSIDDMQQGIGDIQTSVDNVGTKLEGVQDTLTETKEEITSLPQKIATSITEGVKGLFIPSQEDLTEIKDKYEDMLSEKLGFIWQAYDLLTSFIGDLQMNLESGEAYEFTFPGVKLPMQGEEFILVAETPVSLENDLMDVLRPVLGTIVSAIAVIAFVNMAHDYVLAIVSGISAYEFERRRGE